MTPTYFRFTFSFLFPLLLLLACSGGGNGNGSNSSDGLPPSIPTGSASGAAVDGLIRDGTVTAYSFSGGIKGASLGQTATNANTGAYRLSLQVESQPILLEVTGGYYIEEASGVRVSLQTGQYMNALVNYNTGATITVAITPWTHVASGLAQYQIANGVDINTAITNANNRITQLLGVNILNVIPADVTDVTAASATLSPELQYGFMSAAISQWTYKHAPAGQGHAINAYTSISFIQKMFADVLAEGLLDGNGAAPLSFHTTPLSPTIYRHDLAVDMLAFAADQARNMVGITREQLLPAARAYAASTDDIFGSAAPISIDTPTVNIVSPTANMWVKGTITITGSVHDDAGLTTDVFAVDDTPFASLTTNLTAPSTLLNTTTLNDGSHTLSLTATNVVGMSAVATASFRVDNTGPGPLGTTTISRGPPYSGIAYYCNLSGFASDNGVGLDTADVYLWSAASSSGQTYPATISTNSWFVSIPAELQSPVTATIYLHDSLGNTTAVPFGSFYFVTGSARNGWRHCTTSSWQ